LIDSRTRFNLRVKTKIRSNLKLRLV
jgi:hypothetical protein